MRENFSLDAARLIELPRHVDIRGHLSVIERAELPFEIKRVSWVFDVPSGATRPGRAYLDLEEFIVAASGSFSVVLDDGQQRREWVLNRPYFGLYVPKGMWRELTHFSGNGVGLLCSSLPYADGSRVGEYAAYCRARENGTVES